MGFRVDDFSATRGKASPEGGVAWPTSGTPWALPLDHLSASSMAMLQACPRQWQQRYLQDRREAPGAARVIGQANHLAHDFNWNIKILSGECVPTSTMLDYYHDDVWPGVLDSCGGSGEIKWDTDPDSARLMGEKMVVCYHEQVSPRLEPAVVEKKIELWLPDVPVPIQGYIDLVQVDGRPMVDLKTTSKRETKLKSEWRLQGLVYQLAEQRNMDWHVVTKQKTPQAVTPLEEPGLQQPLNEFQTQHALKLIQDLVKLANFYYLTYGPDDPWPTLGVAHPWRCGWCGYRSDCPAWRVA